MTHDDDLIRRGDAFVVLRKAQIASCTCQIKTPDPDWHNHNCRYRILREVEAMIDHLPDAALPAVTLPDDVAGVVEDAGKVMEGVTPGRVVQFHPSFCKEAEGAPFSEWDTSHDLSVIQPDGKRYRIGSMRHANDAAFFQWCREGVPALIALATTQAAQLDTWRRNARETFDAMCAMRNSINEHVPMPSLESDLLQGPENSVFCAAVAEAVVSHVTAQAAQIAGLEAQLTNTLFEAECEGEDKRDAAYSAAEWQRRAEAATLRAEVERLRGALQWCSGSDDFQDGGKARDGWLKLCAPLLHGEGKT